MDSYVLRTHLLENPEVVFYYKGISKVDPDAPMAMRSVVGFTADDAHVFHSIDEAQKLCERLNQDKTALREGGYAEFNIEEKVSVGHKKAPPWSKTGQYSSFKRSELDRLSLQR